MLAPLRLKLHSRWHCQKPSQEALNPFSLTYAALIASNDALCHIHAVTLWIPVTVAVEPHQLFGLCLFAPVGCLPDDCCASCAHSHRFLSDAIACAALLLFLNEPNTGTYANPSKCTYHMPLFWSLLTTYLIYALPPNAFLALLRLFWSFLPFLTFWNSNRTRQSGQ